MLQWMLHRVSLMRLYAVMGAPIRSGPYSGKPWTNLPELKAASARRRQAVLAPCPPRPCHRNSTKPFSFMELTSLEYGHRLCPEVRRPVGGRAKKKAFVPVKGRRPRKHFAVPPVTCVPTYALPVTGDTGRAYFPRFGVRPAAQEGYSDFRATSFGLSPSPNRCRVPQILLSPSSPL